MLNALPTFELPSSPTDPEAGFGALETSKGPLPLKAMDIHARLTGLLTHTTLRQTFVNTHQEPLEAVYIFPLPPRAAVSRFTMTVGGRTIEGQIREREQARQDYRKALEEGKRAALAEEDRPDVFTLSVGNLMPGDQAEITFELAGLLSLEGDEVEWRFPLVTAPRYIPGTPLDTEAAGLGTTPDSDQVPDASRLNPPRLLPGYPNPVCLGLTVDIETGDLPLQDFRSSLHATSEAKAESGLRIRLAGSERLDRDFILRGRIRAGELCSSAVLIPDEPGFQVQAGEGDATLLVTLIPPTTPGEQTQPRDVVFVLDRSGSMGGWKIQAARRALSRMIDTLGPDDRFGVIAFDDELETFGLETVGLRPGTDRNRYQATVFLAKIDARGGTEMAAPLKKAFETLQQTPVDRAPIVFLVTDGQVGNESRLVQLLKPKGTPASQPRVQILGIDEALNEGLLKRLADRSNGWFLPVESEDRLDEVFRLAALKFGAPIVTGLDLHLPGHAELNKQLVSSGSRDLFRRTPLLLLGRVQLPLNAKTLTLAGQLPTGEVFRSEPPIATSEASSPRRVWARWRIRDLEDDLAQGRTPEETAERMTQLSLTHQVLCRRTAFLAVDEHQVVNPGGSFETLLQPVELPHGWAAGAAVACAAPMAVGIGLTRGVLHSYAALSPSMDLCEACAPDDGYVPMVGGYPTGTFHDTLASGDTIAALEHTRALIHLAMEFLRKHSAKKLHTLLEEAKRLAGWLESSPFKSEPSVNDFLDAFRDLAQVLKKGGKLGAAAGEVQTLGRQAVLLSAWLEAHAPASPQSRRFWDPS